MPEPAAGGGGAVAVTGQIGQPATTGYAAALMRKSHGQKNQVASAEVSAETSPVTVDAAGSTAISKEPETAVAADAGDKHEAVSGFHVGAHLVPVQEASASSTGVKQQSAVHRHEAEPDALTAARARGPATAEQCTVAPSEKSADNSSLVIGSFVVPVTGAVLSL